jgi:hypothetical protein
VSSGARDGGTGDYINLPGGSVFDATTGPYHASAVTNISLTLPDVTDGASLIELRWITADANGGDEWVLIDDIVIGATAIPEPATGILLLAGLWLAQGKVVRRGS